MLSLALCLGAVAVPAQEIYKSIDTQGHVVYSDQSIAPGAERRVQSVDNVPAAPNVLHFCWTNCFTLTRANGAYTRTDGTDESWTVERFTQGSFVLHRHDAPAAWNGFHTDVTYAGDVVNDRLVNIRVDGGPRSDIQMAWGSALETLPGSNLERDRAYPKETLPLAASPFPLQRAESRMTASEAPPPLDDDDQPPCAIVGGIWTPGYWAWSGRYIWLPGAWVRAPRVGVLWTPGYWALAGTVYIFHPGHWGPNVGYYGEINYGHGYFGFGYVGGRWQGATFAYNTAVSNVDMSVIHSTYRESPRVPVAVSKVSFHVEPPRAAKPAPAHVAAASAPRAPSRARAEPLDVGNEKPATGARVDRTPQEAAPPKRSIARSSSSGRAGLSPGATPSEEPATRAPEGAERGGAPAAKAR